MAGPVQTIDPNIFPSEIFVTPYPLIAFFGLDLHDSAHKTIWDSFTSNRSKERVGLNYKLVSVGEEFPVAKPKTRTYEWYQPKGIIKRNWLHKHLNVVPAVAVLFEDLEWGDPQWTEKQLQCASHVQSIKNSLQGRNTRLIVVLLQKGSKSDNVTEDLTSSERAANLAASCCDINAKMLFVLPYADQHLLNHVLRLETTFYEHANAYYTLMEKTVRAHKDQLSANHQSHLGLMIRHNFKLGMISEFQHDFNTALKHYKKSYSYLDEFRIVDTNCMEVKTVAGLLTYKMCKLMFKLNIARDALTHFRAHIEKYKNRLGFRELEFEHHAWVGVQNNIFAELFCEAVKHGLAALQTEHPGIYYRRASECIHDRRKAYLRCIEAANATDVPISGQLYSEFHGVRAIKNGEAGSETHVIRLLQEQEKNFNYSMAIITLLGQAMAQYKLYKCLRQRKRLAVLMADEYFRMGDYTKALTLYSLMLVDYRDDQWYRIFTAVLMDTLRSAYLAASTADFVSCSIEALSKCILIDKTERLQILENLWKVFDNVVPMSPQQLVPELKTKWESQLASFKSPVFVDLSKISNILECKATFERNTINCDESYRLFLCVRNCTETVLKVRKFRLILWDAKVFFKVSHIHWKEYFESVPHNEPEIPLEPGKCYQMVFESTQGVAETTELQIVKIEIEIGSKNYAVLSQTNHPNQNQFREENILRQNPMALVDVISSCYVKPTFHLVAQVLPSDQPMLVNEYFEIQIQMTNSFGISLQNVGISITVPAPLRNSVFLTTELNDENRTQQLFSHVQFDIGDLPMQSTSPITYYIISLIEVNIELKQKIWYQTTQAQVSPIIEETILESPVNEKCLKRLQSTHDILLDELHGAVKKIKEDTIIVGCVEEFNFCARFYTLSRQALMRAYRDEDFLLRVNINVKSPIDIKILDSFFISDHNISEQSKKNCKKLKNKIYRHKSNFEDIVTLRPNCLAADWLSKSKYLNEHSKTPEPPKYPQNAENNLITKTIYNNAIDALYKTQDSRNCNTGFIHNLAALEKQSFGVYCVRWQRWNSSKVNESRFVVSGVDVVEPPLNIYCFITEKFYVKVPIPLKIALKNPTNKILNLHITLSPSPSFMFSGHKYLDITIFAKSSYELAYNLYPLKAGWHQLPELQLEYTAPNYQPKVPSIAQELATAIAGTEIKREPDVQQAELNNLVKRWMPKWVFVHPPNLS